MKQSPSELSQNQKGKFLILSDGKPGHVNQSIAFAKHLNSDYDLCPVSFRGWWGKAVSYLADRCGLRLPGLFRLGQFSGRYAAVVSAGSSTYYANRVLADKLAAKSVAIMLPKGYRYDFDLIVAQQHDDPPERENILPVPINLAYTEPQGVVTPDPEARYIALIVGGHSAHGQMAPDVLQDQVKQIFSLFPDHKIWLTTSRRTPEDVEEMLQGFNFERAVYYSKEQINPIPDFLQHSDYVFLTADSSSMISEAVSFGRCCVEVLPLSAGIPTAGKFNRLIRTLAEQGCLHVFDGSCAAQNNKISLADLLPESVRFRLALTDSGTKQIFH